MNSLNIKLLLSFVIFASLVTIGSSIRCYVCNSHHDQGCMDIDEDSKAMYAIDCNSIEDDNKYTLCRKIDMSLDTDFGKAHPAEKRIHRACGYKEHEEGDCYYKSGYNTRSWVCACYTDDCNGSETIVASPFLFLIVLAFKYAF